MSSRFSFVAGSVIAGVVSFLIGSVSFADKHADRKKEHSPEEPYEEFMLQRTYPNRVFEVETYKAALNDAVERSSAQRSPNTISWQLEGPGNIGGRFNCVAVDPNNTNMMYAGSANGGVWKTTNGGGSWNPITDMLPYQAIGAIAINPNNSNEIWIGTGDLNISGTMYSGDGVYRSMDAGVTWTYLGLSNTYVVSSIIFNPANTAEVLIGTMGNQFNRDNNRGLYRTLNSGTTFTQELFVNDSTGIIDMVQDPSNPNVVYAASYTRQRTYEESVIYGTETYVYKSTDFGNNWTQLAGGLPNGPLHQRIGLAISESSSNIVYALYSTSDGFTEPQLYKTTNSGTTWGQINFNSFDMGAYGSFGWYFGKIYVNPSNPNTLYIPGVDLQYSTDGGVNWNMLTPVWWLYEVHADGHHMHFFNGSNFIYSTDGGLYRTTDGGANWTDIENIPNNQFYAVTENPHVNGEYAGGVQDNGTMWGNASVINNFQRMYGGDGFTVEYTPNPQLVYSESQYGNIVFDDAFPTGNWQGIDMDGSQTYNWHTPYFTSDFNSTTLYYGGQNVTRIYGAPYGQAQQISPSLVDPNSPWRVQYITSIDQSPLDSTKLYAGTADGKVWNTLNNGSTWNDITPFQSSSYYVTRVLNSPNNSSTAYVTRSGYRANDNTPLVFKTINNGTSWTNVSGDLPALAVNDILVYPGDENVMFVANDAGVYYTQNAGVNWTRLGNNMPYVAVLDIHFNYNSTKIIAGTFGRSIYTADVSTITGVESISSNRPAISVYPNPAIDVLNISASANLNSIIYNVKGERVLSASGSAINIAGLSAGVYFIEIDSNGTLTRQRFLKH
jgi:photosystem II stability/assembly factor-like uncharacterized protein